jgi:hypothetical protein
MLPVVLQGTTDLISDSPAKLNHFCDNILSRFQNHEFLTRRQSDDGIRRNFDMLNQIGVDNERDVVQPGKLYHLALQLFGSHVYRPD